MKIKYEVIFMQNEYEKVKTRMKIDLNLRLQFQKKLKTLTIDKYFYDNRLSIYNFRLYIK